MAANLHKLLFAFMRSDWILPKKIAINLSASFVALATYGRNQPYHHCTWFEALWQTGCQHCCHHSTALAGRWHRLAAGSKNVPPDLEFELRDRKLPDLHLKTGTRGRENINLHFRALVQMQKKSLTSDQAVLRNNGPLFCRVLSFKPEDTSL